MTIRSAVDMSRQLQQRGDLAMRRETPHLNSAAGGMSSQQLSRQYGTFSGTLPAVPGKMAEQYPPCLPPTG